MAKDAINQHKAMAMGKKVYPGMAKGGAAKGGMHKGGMHKGGKKK